MRFSLHIFTFISKEREIHGISERQAHVQHHPSNQQRRLSSCEQINHGSMYRFENQHPHDCQMRGGVIFHWRLFHDHRWPFSSHNLVLSEPFT